MENIKINTISDDDLYFIKNSLLSNKGISSVELKKFEKNHPYVINKVNNEYHIIDCKKEYYGLDDNNFNDFLIKKFSKNDWVLDTFYKLTYTIGDFSLPHKDVEKSVNTVIVLLSDNFKGGETIINGIDINLNKVGMYVSFDGSKFLHGVNKIISGTREVLVIWFNKKNVII